MPDVTRSDSQRSDASLKPRVSFNRDVHVKRIVPRESARAVGALSGDGAGHLVASPVRKERLNKSKKELAEEAKRILHQADRIDCVTKDTGVLPDKFYTLPNRKKKDYSSASLDRRIKRRGSLELTPPEKPPRTFAASPPPQTPQKTSIFDIFKKEKRPEPKKSNLRRSVSDASNIKSKVYGPNNGQSFRKRSGSDEDIGNNSRNSKKQLSPIIEVTQRDDYFSPADIEDDKENIKYDENFDIRSPARKKNKKESVTDKLKEYIDEVDEALYKETGIRVSPPKEEVKSPQPIIIDVDKAEKISEKKKFKDSLIGKKLKSITHKKNKTNEANNKTKKSSTKNKSKVAKVNSNQVEPELRAVEKPKLEEKRSSESISPSPKIKEAVENFEKLNKTSPTMIHSSQKPVDKLPLTKGRTVNSMIKQLSSESCSPPPPRTNVLISPHGAVQHNNNQPFSYTRGISPEKYMSNENIPNPGSPIIYAQVVCGSNGTGQSKQTVHTTYTNGKKHPNSDSDEGLGGEENSGFSRLEKTVTHFGDDSYNEDSYRKSHRDDYFDEDKFEEESPITPKFRSPAYRNGFSGYERKTNEFSRMEQTAYFDSSSRGRGDGMDAKRRESLTENENGFITKTVNGRSDLSARRDLLESRLKSRINDKSLRTSPEYIQNTTPTNVYISESTSKYYRGGSTSPVGYTEKYISETRTDKYSKPLKYESRSKQYFGDRKDSIEYEIRGKPNGYQYNGFDSEPKSFDSQISDYRSSPENRHFESSHNKSNNRYNARSEKQRIFKDKEIYKSTPEIHQKSYQESKFHDSYHDSLRREKVDNRIISSSKYKSERYLDQSENERKDKFGDSGIENDFRRDSGDNFRVSHPPKSRREYCNDSEDEGFASSLLIASERQHTEDNINQRKRKDYDSDRTYSREDDHYRQLENMDYKSKLRNDYVPRERSIDDGSHYDPRIDKEVDRSTLKRVDKKPPKPEKKSGLEKVKSLFSRDSKKKKEKQQAEMVREESLRARYVEYKGRDTVDAKPKKKNVNEVQTSYDYSNRRRLSTPSPSPTRETQRNGKSETTHGSWFKSLDRLSRKKTKKEEKEGNLTSGTEEELSTKPTPTKNLRFFGDTDIESNDSIRQKSTLKSRPGITSRDRTRSQSTRDLHNISEELRTPDLNVRRSSHKSMTNISESDRDTKGSRMNLKPPMSPNHRTPRDISRQRDDRDRGRRRKNEVSSVESSTEGDSSQQSQRSVVYLHAATVGDIPGPGYLRNGRRAASREELASNGSSRMQPQVKTLSRSFSVLAPWKPRHPREAMDIDYTQYPKPTKNGKYEQKTPKNTSSRKDNSSTLKKKAQETRKNNSTLNRKSKSKENVSSQTLRRSREELSKGSNSTLYKKKERLPRENSRYNRDREDKKMSSKSLSVESLGSNGRNLRKSRDESRDISRSVSMPRDPEKSAGWFKMKRNKISGNTQRL